jgi:lipid-A-disaccharide synthase-like uncharacterized protein
MSDTQWTIFGLAFQSCFMARFLVQWIASEKAKKSVIPISFWFLSIIGASGLLTYAVVHLKDPVFAIGQTTGFFIYFRNLFLIRKAGQEEAAAKLTTPEPDTDKTES